MVIHIHEALYKEKGLINSGGKINKYGQEILKLLDAVWAPKWVAIIHCQGHLPKGRCLPGESGKLTRRPKKQPS
jgi:hypothetical protein